MSIETKVNLGDTIFYLKQIKRVACPICSGDGKIILTPKVSANSIGGQIMEQFMNATMGNVKEYTCPECNGKGTVKTTERPRYEVGIGVVFAIEATLNQDTEKVVYRVVDTVNNSNRTISADNLYMDRESAEKQCAFMNLERRMVHINEIEIPHSFASTIPCNEKLMRRLDEWRSHRKFKIEICVDENLKLFDGYTSYLVYKMFGITEVPVVICTKV